MLTGDTLAGAAGPGHDAETTDVETTDVETTDAETPDVETTDAETPDAETPDAETPDAGGSDALVAALMEVERHVGEAGWDQPARGFALVRTDELIVAEPALAEKLSLRSSDQGMPPGALTAVESEDMFPDPQADPLGTLMTVGWPQTVFGCAVALERTFIPADAEPDLPDDDAEAAEFVANHPRRQDIRIVAAADRAGNSHAVARLASRPGELLTGSDLVPGLAAALAHTLT